MIITVVVTCCDTLQKTQKTCWKNVAISEYGLTDRISSHPQCILGDLYFELCTCDRIILEPRQVSARPLLPITCFLRLRRVKRGTREECENVMVWGSTAEMGRELVWACGRQDAAAVLLTHDCRIQPWCHPSLSSVSLRITPAVGGGVYFSHGVKWKDLIRECREGWRSRGAETEERGVNLYKENEHSAAVTPWRRSHNYWVLKSYVIPDSL